MKVIKETFSAFQIIDAHRLKTWGESKGCFPKILVQDVVKKFLLCFIEFLFKIFWKIFIFIFPFPSFPSSNLDFFLCLQLTFESETAKYKFITIFFHLSLFITSSIFKFCSNCQMFRLKDLI